jgi:hypothetical protein
MEPIEIVNQYIRYISRANFYNHRHGFSEEEYRNHVLLCSHKATGREGNCT